MVGFAKALDALVFYLLFRKAAFICFGSCQNFIQNLSDGLAFFDKRLLELVVVFVCGRVLVKLLILDQLRDEGLLLGKILVFEGMFHLNLLSTTPHSQCLLHWIPHHRHCNWHTKHREHSYLKF